MSTAEHDKTKLGYIFVLVVQVALDRKLVKSLSRGCSSPRNGFVLPANKNFHLIVGRENPSPTHLQIPICRDIIFQNKKIALFVVHLRGLEPRTH